MVVTAYEGFCYKLNSYAANVLSGEQRTIKAIERYVAARKAVELTSCWWTYSYALLQGRLIEFEVFFLDISEVDLRPADDDAY